jgi:hypothetical protein
MNLIPISRSALRTWFVSSLCFLAATGRGADAPHFGRAADNKIYAQSLVSTIMAENPLLVTAGIHCVPAQGGPMVILASTLDVIGKPSDPEDIQVGVEGLTHVYPNPKFPKLGIMLPLHDRDGRIVGALALAFKYKAGDDQAQYFVAATAIREKVARRIAQRANLYAPAP